MAEAALFSLAGKLLAELASPTFKKACERVRSIRKAREDLEKLSQTIQIIQAVLLDAEKKHYEAESAAVREWIQRVKDVLYDADDLFDDVATDALLKEKEGTKLSKVLASSSNMFRTIISDDNIAKKVKAIRKRLDEISKDMDQFKFMQVLCEKHASVLREREQTKPFVDEKVVIGRVNEKNEILKFLFDESTDVEQSVSVICIVGIGGMGKTTLAQLIYNDNEVQQKFSNKWWACISNNVGDTNVLERIARSMNKDFNQDSDPREQICSSVRKEGSSYLLVLDDVWDNDLGIWVDIMSMLSSGEKGSKIIVTTRLESVKKEFQNYKSKIFTLNGLSEDMSWELFKKRAFTEKQENDVERWNSLGWEIMHKCSNVPLAIKSIASLLREKNTIQEWESFNKNELFKIKVGDDSIMSTLKLSYDHLLSDLKNCFAYCSLFPQDHIFVKKDLISLWIAQGYVNPSGNETFEEAGHSYFMELFRKSFFQEAEEDEIGESVSYKMHDLMHDLAKEVAGKECLTLTTGWNQFSENARHLYVCSGTDDSEKIGRSLPDGNRLRSCVSKPRLSFSQQLLDELLTKSKLLRSLDLSDQGLKNVPCSIGDLKHLRYLNLSKNKDLTSLPDSLTKLVNLLTLNIFGCFSLKELPNDFRKLVKLRHFYYQSDNHLRYMPPGFGELTNLQHLDYFKVGKKDDCCSRLDVLANLKLEGKLIIGFDYKAEPWDVDESWKLPTTLQELYIKNYPGRRIPHWKKNITLPIFVRIEMYRSLSIENLPPFRCLPSLKVLVLVLLDRLEYVEEEEEEEEEGGGHSTAFFPCLEVLELQGLPNLKGWSRKLECPSFPLLSQLFIGECPQLMWMPLCSNLRTLAGGHMSDELTQQLLSAGPYISLESIQLYDMNIKSFSGQTFPSLRRLIINGCDNLKHLGDLNLHLERLALQYCSKLELGEVEWDSLPKLRQLQLYPRTVRLPDSLQKLVDFGQLDVQFSSQQWDAMEWLSGDMPPSIRRIGPWSGFHIIIRSDGNLSRE